MLSEMARHPVISAEQERALWHRYRVEHEPRAGHELVLANLRFVVMIARQYRGRGVPLGDLIQQGNIGLVRAVQRFSPDMGYRLTSYAIWWIRSEIQGLVLSSYSMVRLGTSRAQRKVFFSLARARRELRASRGAGGPPEAEELEELARKLGVRTEELDELLRRIEGRDVSIEAKGGAISAIGESCTWPPEPADGEAADLGERLASLRAAVARLCPRDRLIVEARHICAPPVKLKELAAQLGVTTARVYQLEVRAVQRLREALGADVDVVVLPARTPPPGARDLREPPRLERTERRRACPPSDATGECTDCTVRPAPHSEPEEPRAPDYGGEAELGT